MNYRQRRTAKAGSGLFSLLMVGVLAFNAMPAAAVDFAHPAFKRVWDRTDSVVASGQVSRTWFWGPEPKAAAQEQYVDAPTGTGTRLVQYFDKSRMEINNPNADQSTQWFVTNGLLTIELISGQMQIGNDALVNRYPANIPISGDTDDTNAPTYASFIAVSNTRRGDHPQANRVGQFATSTINKAGQVGDDQSKASTSTKIAYYEPTTKHNIPEVFWQFLNASGPVSETGKIETKRLIDPWFYASGFPISDAYWSKVKIKGEQQDVLIQAFERRVLTFVPTNVPGFQVEMGNIGLHYYDWRYRDAGKPPGTPGSTTPTVSGPPLFATNTPIRTPGTPVPTATGIPGARTPDITGTPAAASPTPTTTPNVITQGLIAFASDRIVGNREIYTMRGDGTSVKNVTNRALTDDYPAFSPDGTKIAFTSARDGNDEIYVMNIDGTGITRLTNNAARDYEPAWSPDGTKIAFVSNRSDGQSDIFVMDANGTNQTNLTFIAGEDTDPSWGTTDKLVFASTRSGTRQLYSINPNGGGLVGPLTSSGENYLPKWNTVANRIVFVSSRDGNQEIYTMRQGGEEQTRLTNNTWADWDPAYAPDNSKIVFSSELFSGNLDIYFMNIDGSNQVRITTEAGADVHPAWKIQR